MPIAYIAHAITAPAALGGRVWSRHYRSVTALAAEVVRSGYAPVVPVLLEDISHRQAMTADHHLIRMCSVLVVHDSPWTADSPGVKREIAWAKSIGLPVVYGVDELRALAA